jgi:hypothetical protein
VSKFVFAYHGGSRSMSAEQGREHMRKWQAWMAGLGGAVIDHGMPTGPGVTVAAEGVIQDGGPDPLGGFTVVQAPDLAAATEMARACPHLDIGGRIEVVPALDMPM